MYLTMKCFHTICFAVLIAGCTGPDAMRDESEEVRLLRLIKKTPPGPERNLLIAELENVTIDRRTFYERWLYVHDVDPFWDCWSDTGYDPSRSKFSRDVQLLAAASYGKSDIDNGGFHQFFSNGTGVFAPEMAEWFERSGLNEAAKAVRDAIAVFGRDFPRSRHARQAFLAKFEGESREEWDPFRAMNERFYESATNRAFDEAANEWLRQECGIRRLLDMTQEK
jgi:hypothetical protein